MENEKRAEGNERKAQTVIPAQRLFQVQHGEAGENDKCNYFLNGFELGRRIDRAAPAIGWHREPVFEERYSPS